MTEEMDKQTRLWVAERMTFDGVNYVLRECGFGDNCPRRTSFEGITRCGSLTVLCGDCEGQPMRARVLCGVDNPVQAE